MVDSDFPPAVREQVQLVSPQALGLSLHGIPKCKELLWKSTDSEAQAVVGQFRAGPPKPWVYPPMGLLLPLLLLDD